MSGDDIQDRYASRFDDEDEQSVKNVETAKEDETGESDMNAQSVESESDKDVKSVWDVENVKKGWKAVQSFLPESLYERWNDEYDRIRYLSDEDWQKDRDYKPLVFFAALEQLKDLDGEEIDELRERMRDEIQ